MNNQPNIIIALDFDDIKPLRQLVKQLNPSLCRLKIAATLFTRYGPALVEELMHMGFDVFLDLKFHDIPQQVAGAIRSATELGVWMVDLHVLGGQRMLEAAVNELHKKPTATRPLLMGVTILTSLSQQDLLPISINENIDILVSYMARLAQQSGLDGIVCSPLELKTLRQQLPDNFLLLTPGIRLADDSQDDQRRIMTPQAALQAGADYLVIGRSITRAQNPLAVLEKVS